MRNLLLTLRYNGTAFHGWQIQPNAVTVQEELCKAFRNLSGNDENIPDDIAREMKKQKILVVCSFSEKNEHWNMPKGFDLETSKLILCNYRKYKDSTLKPFETRVYLWNYN